MDLEEKDAVSVIFYLALSDCKPACTLADVPDSHLDLRVFELVQMLFDAEKMKVFLHALK